LSRGTGIGGGRFLLALLSLLALAVAAAGCGGSDDSDDESVASTFYGVAPEGQQTAGDYVRMEAGGVGTVRIVLQWSAIESGSKGDYDWTGFDRTIADIANAGLVPLVTVFGTPKLYADEAITPPVDDEKAFAAWSKFLKAAAERYGTDGDFWQLFSTANPDAEAHPVVDWEIWNEPNSSTFWAPKPDPDAYAELIEKSSRVLHFVDPDAKVMSAGMFATPQSDGAIVSYDFLEKLFSVDGVDDAIDVVGAHPYGPDVKAVTDQVEDTRKALDEAGTDDPIWVTEIGWGSNPKSGNDLSKTPEEQAQLLTDSFTALRDSREDLGVEGVVWYTWHDATGSSVGACGWCASAGLVDTDRETKPAWTAYTDVTGGKP
jgi:hypothetical protein